MATDPNTDLIAELRRQITELTATTKEQAKQIQELGTKAALADKLPEVQSQLDTLKAEHATQLEAVKGQHAADLVWRDKGVTDESWRGYFGQAFQKQAEAEGGEKDLGKWLDGLVGDPSKIEDPILKSGLQAMNLRPVDTQAGQPGAGGNPGGRLPSLPNPPTLPSTRPPPAGGGRFDSVEAIQQAMATPEAAAANWAALMQQFPQLATVPAPPGVQTPNQPLGGWGQPQPGAPGSAPSTT